MIGSGTYHSINLGLKQLKKGGDNYDHAKKFQGKND